MSKPKIFVVGGPTASGKTERSIEMAQALNTEIISFDSRQFYQEMQIGTARLLPEEYGGVEHHFMGSHSLSQPLDAVSFALQARPILESILSKRKNVVLVGGSGFYLQALLFDLDEMPPISDSIRQQVNQYSLLELQEQVSVVDPDYYRETDIQNLARLRRALEVWLASKKPWSAFRKSGLECKKWRWDAEMHLCIQNPDRKELHERIAKRTKAMLNMGLKAEALGLIEYRNLPAMNTVGYREWYVQTTESDEEIEASINAHTRQYARRQTTWFNKFRDQVGNGAVPGENKGFG